MYFFLTLHSKFLLFSRLTVTEIAAQLPLPDRDVPDTVLPDTG
jgi:hypothetical protein